VAMFELSVFSLVTRGLEPPRHQYFES